MCVRSLITNSLSGGARSLEAENLSCRSAERDLIGLKKTIEDTQLHRLQLESQVESVKEALAVLKKDHQDVRTHTHIHKHTHTHTHTRTYIHTHTHDHYDH